MIQLNATSIYARNRSGPGFAPYQTATTQLNDALIAFGPVRGFPAKKNGGPGVDRHFINCRALDVSVKVSISKSVPTFIPKSNPVPFSKPMVPPVQQSLTDGSRV